MQENDFDQENMARCNGKGFGGRTIGKKLVSTPPVSPEMPPKVPAASENTTLDDAPHYVYFTFDGEIAQVYSIANCLAGASGD